MDPAKLITILRSLQGTRSPSQMSRCKNCNLRSRAQAAAALWGDRRYVPHPCFLLSPSSLVGAAQSECPPAPEDSLWCCLPQCSASWEQTRTGKNGGSGSGYLGKWHSPIAVLSFFGGSMRPGTPTPTALEQNPACPVCAERLSPASHCNQSQRVRPHHVQQANKRLTLSKGQLFYR